MENAFDGINVLRWYYGMIGQPSTVSRPAAKPFPQACGLALGMKDPATFECFCPVLMFNRWDPELMIQATPEQNLGRLRLAAGVGIFFLNFSRLGIPWAMESAVALKRLEKRLQDYTLEGDPWGDPLGADELDGYYLEFFKPYGLYVNWPLIDFWKQFQWAMRQNHERVQKMLEEAEATPSKALG
jgi:hypothetical protein